MKYKLISKTGPLDKVLNSLSNEVSDAMHQGWEPIGGVSVTKTNPGLYVAVQAMKW